MLESGNFFLVERARQHHWSGAGVRSIKTFQDGFADYRVGCAAYRVGDQGYLILNHGQYYEVTIEAANPVSSFCVFFAKDFARQGKDFAMLAPWIANRNLLKPSRKEICIWSNRFWSEIQRLCTRAPQMGLPQRWWPRIMVTMNLRPIS